MTDLDADDAINYAGQLAMSIQNQLIEKQVSVGVAGIAFEGLFLWVSAQAGLSVSQFEANCKELIEAYGRIALGIEKAKEKASD